MSVKRVEVVVRSPLQSCTSWMFVKQNQGRKKNKKQKKKGKKTKTNKKQNKCLYPSFLLRIACFANRRNIRLYPLMAWYSLFWREYYRFLRVFNCRTYIINKVNCKFDWKTLISSIPNPLYHFLFTLHF